MQNRENQNKTPVTNTNKNNNNNSAKLDGKFNSRFKLDKDKDLQTNKRALGLMVNKILLAYKNKPKFMEEVVMGSTWWEAE